MKIYLLIRNILKNVFIPAIIKIYYIFIPPIMYLSINIIIRTKQLRIN